MAHPVLVVLSKTLVFAGSLSDRHLPRIRLPLPARRRRADAGRPDAAVRQAGHGHRHEVGRRPRRARVHRLQGRRMTGLIRFVTSGVKAFYIL